VPLYLPAYLLKDAKCVVVGPSAESPPPAQGAGFPRRDDQDTGTDFRPGLPFQPIREEAQRIKGGRPRLCVSLPH
jgi:hypothetical protein